ncbi:MULTISPECIES: amino acid synthesis family protein [Burkholderiaceae]|uniref:amino acid synthesis family protein n=1 Tax=Burkholderiaceae TaxID=119060 RepID=UPI001424A680|nr:amino acid synthesis family protein [Paraburkholderia sp. Ac-20342]NIF51066.1 amino acid synthesis family protein [Burkholderia sp. Ax-1724]NIF75903.1 amino acid synthesis family protein [Paraburkholderia sp. Cy-641]
MTFQVRKVVVYKDTTCREGGRHLDRPITMVGVAAVIRNPWAGRGYVEDLSPEQRAGCGPLGTMMVERVLAELKVEEIEAYGKAAVVGAAGEIEHASAVIHNLRFGNQYRNALKAESYLTFTNKRGGLGTSLQIPMKHLHDGSARSHFITLEMSIPDAPCPDEIVIVLGASTGGRAHPRIGNRHLDTMEIEEEAKRAAGA